MYNYLWTLGYVIILNFLYILVAFALWYNLWVKNLGGKPLFSFANSFFQSRFRSKKTWQA